MIKAPTINDAYKLGVYFFYVVYFVVSALNKNFFAFVTLCNTNAFALNFCAFTTRQRNNQN